MYCKIMQSGVHCFDHLVSLMGYIYLDTGQALRILVNGT
jgi:hypothetical protein